MAMSSAYEESGRIGQKQRTRNALIDAARALLSEGVTPTVEQAAASAGVSRPTAYRYFPNQQALLWAANPELRSESLLPTPAPTDPIQRLDAASAALMRLLLEHETALRAMFRIAADKTPETRPPLALRTGRRIAWIEDALEPVREKLGPTRFQRLVLQIGATLGIEPLMWLIDIAHVQRIEAAEILRDSARTLLKEAL
jgi:AcrR family transcriptional regulator